MSRVEVLALVPSLGFVTFWFSKDPHLPPYGARGLLLLGLPLGVVGLLQLRMDLPNWIDTLRTNLFFVLTSGARPYHPPGGS